MTHPSQRRGRFVTFEGGEGTGKTTQLKHLAERLHAAGLDVVVTREPGGTPGGEAIRKLLVEGDSERWSPMTEALLNYAARHEHLTRVILPALAAGRWVLSDRFADSTMAYQGIAGGVGKAAIDALHALVVGKHNPDLTLVLDLPIESGLARAWRRGAGENRFESKNVGYHETLRQAFLDIAKGDPGRCVVLDGAQSENDLAKQIWDVVQLRLGGALTKGKP